LPSSHIQTVRSNTCLTHIVHFYILCLCIRRDCGEHGVFRICRGLRIQRSPVWAELHQFGSSLCCCPQPPSPLI
jgi:hypothetical protein